MIIQENRKNYLLEQELKKLEKKISLLIANRTSIQVRIDNYSIAQVVYLISRLN
jgi:hypothetical protein